jgi:hypothetical protein
MPLSRRALLSLLPAAAVLACSGKSQPAADEPTVEPAPASLPAVREVLRSSSIAMAEVRTLCFRVTHSKCETPAGMGLTINSLEGDVSAPDRVKAAAQGRAGSLDVSFEIVGVEDRSWITNPFTQAWQELPGMTFRNLASPQRWIIPLAALANPVLTGTEVLSGRQTYVIESAMESSMLRAFIPAIETPKSVNLRAWIGVQDALVRQLRLEGAIFPGDPADAVRQVELFDYGRSVQIESPL